MSSANAKELGVRVSARIWYSGLLLLVIVYGYSEVATSYFLSDDFEYLNIISQAETFRAGTAIDTGWEYFRPLTALSFWYNYLWFGGETSTSYHLLALLAHWVNALLVARLAWRFCPQPFAAGFAGAVFAALPVHPECITWISARADVLCATGTLLLLTGWLDYLRNSNSVVALVEAFLGLVYALLTKDSAMILPVVMLALAFVYRRRPDRKLIMVFLGIVVVFAIYMVSRHLALGGFLGKQSVGNASHLSIDLPNAIGFTIDAMRSMVLPRQVGLQGWLYLISVLCLGSVFYLSLVFYMGLRHQALVRFVAVSWPLLLVFLLHLAPVANAVRMDLSNGVQTRFLYMPSMFYCVALGVLLGTGLTANPDHAGARRRSMVLRTAAGILVLIYAVATRSLNRPWAEAAAMSRGIVTQLQEFVEGKDYEWVLIHDLPDSHEGAYLFRNGLGSAIKLFVSEKLVFPIQGKIDLATWNEGVQKRRQNPDAHSDILLLRWDRQSRRLIRPK